MLERYLIPLAPYALLAMACCVSLFLFVSLHKEIWRLKVRLARREKTDHASVQNIQVKVTDFDARLHDVEENTGIAVPATFVKSSLNLNKRTQVVRMSRRGETAASIASSLSIPRKEVDLLLKVYRLMLKSSNEITS
jgi:hypothetical protein